MTVGIDEVGRGCLAGPVVAGAVVLKRPIAGLADSKILTKLQRARLDKAIRAKALAFGLGWATVEEIDSLGLTAAVRLAMERAFAEVSTALGDGIESIIIDGSYNFFKNDARAQTMVDADALMPVVSAASIIAKVARDTWMATEAARQFPLYKFEQHVGYGTRLHRQLLAEHGVSALHRRSFKPVMELLANDNG